MHSKLSRIWQQTGLNKSLFITMSESTQGASVSEVFRLILCDDIENHNSIVGWVILMTL